jgi:hypothetical protein
MVKASISAATPERKGQSRHIIGWLDWVGVERRRHAIFALDDGTRLQIQEQERSNEVPSGERERTERVLWGV